METLSLWPGGLLMEASRDAAPISTDSVLLADFARTGGAKRLLDLGSGSGILALLLLMRSPGLSAELAEISPEAAALSERNIALNGLSHRARVIPGDLRELTEAKCGRFDVIISNPPYFPVTGGRSPDGARRTARDEGQCALPELLDAAARLLGQGGRFYMVYPAGRMAEALSLMRHRGLEPKRLRLVQGRVDTPPSLFLTECVRLGRPGLTAEPVLILKNPDGTDTAEAKRIYHTEN